MKITVPPEDAGIRLDVYLLGGVSGMSRNAAQGHIERGEVLVNGNTSKKNYLLRAGDLIEVEIAPPVPMSVEPERIALDIIYEDCDLIVVNKPKGMVTHPAAGHYDGTLVNALLFHCGDSLSGINGVLRPGIVHRLDKDTSGLILAAKNDAAHHGLAAQIKRHGVSRIYEAIVCGNVKDNAGTIDAPVGRHPRERKKMAVTQQGSRPALTHFEVLGRYPGYTHMRLKLETGRTHQIRVHMAHIGHSVLGDDVYGRKKHEYSTAGQCLHAKTIAFEHPSTGGHMEFTVPLPDYFKNILTKLENKFV